MLQFIIKDFQSIKEAKIEVDGFTLLLGQSNQGKSACLRAFIAAVTNRFKTNQVRSGESCATIKVKYSDSPDVLVVQRSALGGSPKMKLGSLEFSKLSRTVPSEVAALNNFGTLKVGEDGYSLNFHEQFQKPLLLEYSQKKVMEILSASKGLDDLNIVKECLAQKRAENRGALNSVDAILNENNAKLSLIKFNLDSLKPFIDSLLPLYTSYQHLLSNISSVDNLYSLFQELSSLESRIGKISRLLSLLSEFNSVRTSLVSACALFDLLISQHSRLAKISIYHKFCEEYDSSVYQSLYLSNSLLTYQSSLKSLIDTYQSLQSRISILSKIVELKKSLSLSNTMLLYLQSYYSLSSQRLFMSNRIDELNKFLVEHVCPVCGSIIN